MKTLLATTGGRPLKNEDAKLFEQLLTMLEGFANDIQDGLIMSGVEITGAPGNYDISGGYIYYSGSICTFTAVTGVALPYVMEKFETDGVPREFFDAATKDTINLVAISAQGGGGYSLELTSPRLSDYTLRKATETEGRAGANDETVMTPLRVLDALRNGVDFASDEANKGTVEKATTLEGINGTADKNITADVFQAIKADDTAVQSGSIDSAWVSPAGLASKDGGLLTALLDIGDWDMDANPTKDVVHGLDLTKIRSVSFMIRNDDGTFMYPNNTMQSSSVIANECAVRSIDSDTINMIRFDGSTFDSTDFNATSYNRGWIIVDYVL